MKKLLLIVALQLCMLQTFAAPRLIAPQDGHKTSNNMPTLSWTGEKCDHYELWVNGIMVETFPSDQTACTAFPMSFGENIWKIVAVSGNESSSSQEYKITIDDAPLAELPVGAQLLRKNWKVQSSLEVGMDGKQLSSGAACQDWYTTSLPATALTALVRNGVYPNPYVSFNNMKIPDSNDEYNKEFDLLKYSHIKGKNPWSAPYWFVKEFELSNPGAPIVWLNMAEINYRADVWVNGHKVADHTTVAGMERGYRFDVSNYINRKGTNTVAIAIYPVLDPGCPSPDPVTPLSAPGVNMGDGAIATSYTKWDAIGWDWQPPVRDRDMGITEDVFISYTDQIEVNNLYVSSEPTAPEFDVAEVIISADVVNHSNYSKEVDVTFTVGGNGTDFTITKTCKIAPKSTVEIHLDSEAFADLKLQNPALWWPFGYGEQPLYSLDVKAKSSDGDNFTANTEIFGVRKVETYIGCPELVLEINGVKIYPKGGNWVTDMMLNWTASRYAKEILLTKGAGMNILRVWGPTGVPSKAMYRTADKEGVLMWQDYLNDFYGTHKNMEGYRPDAQQFTDISIEVTKKYRNHPSLIMWCGGNEGLNPREEILMEKVIKEYDGRNSRFYLRASNQYGLHGGGPYHTIAPNDYFTYDNKLFGFSSEIGPSGVPVVQSFKKFMPELGELEYAEGRFPLDGAWAFHDANNFPDQDLRKFSSYDDILRGSYGDVKKGDGAQAYIRKAQAVNYDVYRASIESINRQLWRNASGIILWKSNSSWPSIPWQVYDWYLQSHAGYYGTKKASQLFTVQLNRNDNTLSALNLYGNKVEGALLEATLYDKNLKVLWSKKENVSIDSNSVLSSDIVVPETEDLCFLKLKLTDKENNRTAENFYWMGSNRDYSELEDMDAPKLSVKVSANNDTQCCKSKYTVTVKNSGKSLAFLTSFSIVGSESRQEFLPAFWSDNYISLLPGESKVLTVEIFNEDITEAPALEYTDFMGRVTKSVKIK